MPFSVGKKCPDKSLKIKTKRIKFLEVSTMTAKTIYDLKLINRTFNRCDYSMYAFAINRLVWLKKYRKAPVELLDALIVKATGVFDGSYYGNEPEEKIIEKYLEV